jgi:hypothetical protein
LLNDFLLAEHHADGSLKLRDDGTLDGLYRKPAAGIPASDFEPAVLDGLYRLPQHGVPMGDLDTSVRGSLAKADSALQPSLVSRTGDLLVASGSGVVSHLSAGDNGQMLVADSSQTVGLRWAPQPTGNYDPTQYGARLDAKRVDNVSSSSGSKVVTAPSAQFTSADIGKRAVVYNDTQTGVFSTIASVQSATQITLADNAGLTLAASAYDHLVYGTDDTVAIQAAIAAAAAAQNVNMANGANTPLGLGNPLVDVPAIGQGGVIISATITIPSGINFNCNSMLFNFLPDRTVPCVVARPYTVVGRLLVDCLQGTGVLSAGGSGSGTGTQAHNRWGDVRIWQVGATVGTDKSQYAGITFTGYHHEVGDLWVKGGNVGAYHNPGHDVVVHHAYFVGCTTAVSMNSTDNAYYGLLKLDSCGTTTGSPGVDLYNRCSWIHMSINAFTQIATKKCTPVVQVGTTVAGTNKDLYIEVQANNTGGVAAAIAYTAESYFKLVAGNTQDNGVNNAIMTAVQFGGVATSGGSGALQVDAAIGTGITPYAGTVYGELSYTQDGVKTIVTNSALNLPTQLKLQNLSAEPATNPSGGAVLYAYGGAIKARGANGTVTTIAAA